MLVDNENGLHKTARAPRLKLVGKALHPLRDGWIWLGLPLALANHVVV